MYKHILVTLDGSEASEAALAEARRLAEGTDAKVTLCTIAEEPQERPSSRTLPAAEALSSPVP